MAPTRPIWNDLVVMTRASNDGAPKRKLQRARQALGVSISSAALLAASPQDDQVRPKFPTIELLEQRSNSKERQQSQQIQYDQNGRSMMSSVSAPVLSPIRAPTELQDSAVHVPFLPSSSSVMKSTPKFVNNLHEPENVDLFAYSSALCHRLTGRYLPKKLLQQDPNAQQTEIARIQRHPKLLKAIESIRVLSTQFKEVARETVGHRKELGHTLFRIEESYLKLFESLLEISLSMYWNYEQASTAERAADKATAEHWKEMHGWKASECKKLSHRLEVKEALLRTKQIELEGLTRQIAALEEHLIDHRGAVARVHELMNLETQLRAQEREIQGQLEQLQRTYAEMTDYSRKQLEESRAQHKHIVDDLKKSLREKDKIINKQDVAIRELSVHPEPVVYITNSSQTEVDDDGLWDTQDGIPRFVSKTTLHRMMWRRFNAFVTCKNCGGRPIPRARNKSLITSHPESSDQDSSEFTDVWSLTRTDKVSKKMARRRERSEQRWELPASTLLFLSNLPKSVMAFPFYTLEEVITQIEKIYDDKLSSDQVDESDGVAQEELPKFICEYFLKSHELRQSAEIALYRFLVSVKNEYLRNSHVYLFARFSKLLRRDANKFEDVSAAQQTETSGRRGSTKGQANILSAASSEQSSAGRRKGTYYLDRSFLRVYLLARHYLLRKPPHSRPKRGRSSSSSNKTSASPAKKLADRETPHLIQVDGLKKWVPLDHAIVIVKWYLSYLPDEVVVAYCREVEHSTAIYIGGAITEVSGNRLAVRAEMRRAMLGNNAESTTANNTSIDASDADRSRAKPLIVADVHKVLELLITALEERQADMAKDLVALFDMGDTNHDRVLSLTEFTAIIRHRVPHFSDRRVLRMFREALMGGEDQSFALSMEAFVQVCSDHGLVSLLPDDRMQDLLLPPKPALGERSVSSKNLASALDALTDPKRQRRVSGELSGEKPGDFADSLEPISESNDIPEELPSVGDDGNSQLLSARAEEVSDDEDATWEW